MPRQFLLDTVRDAYDSGLCINPPRQDGSKAPMGVSDTNHSWGRFKNELPTWAEVSAWYENPERVGVGVFCGSVSNNLEAIDFDDRPTFHQFKELAVESGLGDLIERIEAGYLEYSPHGAHYLYRCAEIGSNTKLATRPKTPSEKKHANDNIATLIETRGEGGYLIIAPTYGEVNPAGAYLLQSGKITTIPTITPTERKSLFEIARSFNVPDAVTVKRELDAHAHKLPSDGHRPGDDYNSRGDWLELLTPHGWQPYCSRGGTTYWTRPGKNHGVSATTNHAGSSLLYVFSSSTIFEPCRWYSKFNAFATLNHEGDFSAAARTLSQQGYGTSPKPKTTTSEKVSPESDITAPKLFTDTRVSYFFASLFSTTLRYWPKAKSWLVYDGSRWSMDVPGGPYPHVKLMVRGLHDRGHAITDDEKRKEYFKQVLTLESHKRQTTILAAAEKIPELVVDGEELDSNPMLLTVNNGTIDLADGSIRPHSPADLITKIVKINYLPGMECPVFHAFLDKIFDGNANLIGYIQRFIGYSLTGRIDAQVLLFFYGTGSNGKTTLANLVERLLGEFASTAGSDLLLHKDNRSATNDVAALRGARLVKISEFDDGERLAEAQIKTLTGGDRITCRFLYSEFFQYTPTYKIILLGNHKPRVRGSDHGIWRRIHLLPFKVTITEAEKDPLLYSKLVEELPGILNWAIDGCLEWQRIGLSPPPEVLEEVNEYRRSEDVLQQWLDECCITGNGYQASANELLRSFIEFSNWRHISSQKFGRMLAEKDFMRGKSNTIIWYGIDLLEKQPGGLGGYAPNSENPTRANEYEEFSENDLYAPKSPNQEGAPPPDFDLDFEVVTE